MYEKDKVSVIMGIRNCAGTLPEAIDSIINQTYTNWELIMCDDASTDNTYEVAKTYKDKYPEKIILLQNEKNSYLAYSLNRCLEKATGEYIARMDGDDISKPERFEKQIKYLKEHPEIQLVGTAMQRFSDNGLANIIKCPECPDRYTLRNQVPFCHATIVAYKTIYDNLGGYSVLDRTKRSQDYDLWFRFYSHDYSGHNIVEPLYLVREDINSIKRRTFKSRWSAYKTTLYGFKLLNYPKWWIIKPTVEVLIKSMIPSFVVRIYREYERNK